MRRGSIRVGILAVVLLGIVVTGFVAYGRGVTAGQKAASSDRSAFGQSRGTAVAGGFGGAGGRRAGSASGPTGGGAASAVSGTVTKISGGTLTLQPQTGTATTVTTNASTTVTTFAPGALSDLAMGDVIAVQGDKTGDTAFTAKTIFALNAAQGRGTSGQTAGTGAAGTPSGGGRTRGGGGATSGSPASGAPGSPLLPGLNGPIGRITQIAGGTLTLQGFDGSTTTVTTNATTSVRKQAPGMVSDIKAGDTLSVQGDPTGDPTAPASAIIDLGTLA
ncbi:MAG: DUF5666 domain-containing protein [Thermomicrobiales bacterium]